MSRHGLLPKGFFPVFGFLTCTGTFAAGLTWIIIDARQFAPIADFKCFYAAGRIVAEGKGSELYLTKTQQAMIERVVGGHHKYFFNPPVFALPFVPLSQLPLMAAYWTWTALSLLALAVGLRLLLPLTGLSRAEQWVAGAAALAFEPTYHNLRWGNISGFLLLLATLFIRDLLAGKERRAGFWLALLMVKPELFLISAVVLAGKRRWQVVSSFLETGMGLLLLSLAVVGFQGFGRYIKLNVTAATSYTPVQSVMNLRAMPTWRGLFVRLLGGGPLAESLALVFMIVSLLVLWMAWRGDWRPDSGRFGQQWALTWSLSILMSPHVYLQSLLLLVPAGVLLLRPFVAQGEGQQARQMLPHLVVSAAALSWLPHVEPLWGVTAVQLGLIAAAVALTVPLLNPLEPRTTC